MRKRLASIIMSAVMLCASVVNAAGLVYTVKYDSKTETVTVEGTGNPREAVTLEVLYPEKTGEDAYGATVGNFKETVYRVDQTIADSKGSFKFLFKMNNMPTDSYLTRINATDGDVINYINKAEALAVLNAVNGADNAESVISVLEEHKNIFGTFEAYFDTLGDEAKQEIAEEIISQRNQKTGMTFDSCDEIIAIVSEEIVIETMNTAEDDVSSLIKAFESVLKLKELEVYQLFEKQSNKNEILNNLVKDAEFDSINEIRNRFAECTVLYAPKNMRYDRMYDFITMYNYILDVDFTEYNKLSSYNKAKVMQMLIGKAYESTEEFKKVFEGAVSSVYEDAKNDKPTGGGSSGGGGGGGSGGGSLISAPAKTEVNTEVSSGNAAESLATVPFVDLTGFEWAEESIIALYQKGAVGGKSNNMFCPGDNIKREEFVKMLICAMEETTGTSADIFTDVDRNMWYAEYVNKAAELGWVNGIGESEFGVGKDISRQDIATILYRVSALKSINLNEIRNMTFNDADKVSEYAAEAVSALANAGIISGDSAGDFAPKRSATRAETAKLIDAFLKLCD